MKSADAPQFAADRAYSYAINMARNDAYSRFPTPRAPCIELVRFLRAMRRKMFELLLLGAGVLLFCLLIAYERLSNRL